MFGGWDNVGKQNKRNGILGFEKDLTFSLVGVLNKTDGYSVYFMFFPVKVSIFHGNKHSVSDLHIGYF